MNNRILGYDFARAFAIFGMVIVNFKIVMSASTGSKWLIWAAGLIEGRAAATFVILAGVGISLMTAKARLDLSSSPMSRHRLSLLKRSILLIVLGLSYSPIWPADILHFYGFYIAISILLLSVKDRILILCSIISSLAFVLLIMVFDYETGWDWITLTYNDFWTLSGTVRHIFFNGFHPVFPWVAFLFIGMWMGRLDLSSLHLRRKIMLVSAILWVGTELLSHQALIYLDKNPSFISPGEAQAIFGTNPMPPMPLYMVSAGSAAFFFIMLCISLTSMFADHRWVDILCKTGQMSLTFYMAHVVIGMGVLEFIGELKNQSIEFALACALLFNILSIIFAYFWMSKFKIGPLEKIFRKLSG